MKIGLTISNYYKAYIEEIAKMNNMPVTTICGIILENFLNFNKDNKRYPIIRQFYKMTFESKKCEKIEENVTLEEEQYVNTDIDEPNEEIEYDPNDPYTWKSED